MRHDKTAVTPRRQRSVRTVSYTHLINRFAAGLAKKAVLANTCGLLADQFILTDAAVADVSQFTQNAAALSAKPAVILWMGVLFFMLQIYLDFSDVYKRQERRLRACPRPQAV